MPEVPATARVNTIAYDIDAGSYAHGVQLGLAEAAKLPFETIRAANADKIDHLTCIFLVDVQSREPIATWLEWAPVVGVAPFARLGAAQRRLNSAALYVASPIGGFEGECEAAYCVALKTSLPPLSDVMNVEATATEFGALFSEWGVPAASAAKPYIFEI